MIDENDDATIPELGCVPGGLIDTRNMEEMKRRREVGLWFWSDDMDAYYAEQLKWQEIEAQIIENLPPRLRQALGYE